MIDDKFIKIGQEFIGEISGDIIKIIDIFIPLNSCNYYVKIECKNIKNKYYKTTETNLLHFKHLLFIPI